MTASMGVLFVVVLVALLGGPGVAQEPDARTILQTALKAMGGDNMKTIQYSGSTGYVASVPRWTPKTATDGHLKTGHHA